MRFPICLLILSMCCPSQAPQQPVQDIVQKLLPQPYNTASLKLPKPSEREDAIKQLKKAQRTAYEARAQQIAFLLAVLDVDYQRNRDYLIWVLKGCDVPEIKNGCDEMTGGYLVFLLQQGHREILAPLLDASVKDYNAAGSESLGAFFSQLVARSPDEFLDAVRSFPPSTQKKICSFAGSGDGGGMEPSDLKRVRAHLGGMHDDEVARRCLLQIEHANKPTM